MPNSDDYKPPPEHERLHQLLLKIVLYQRSLPDGRAVPLDELKREGILEPADIEFLDSNSVTYKPHRLSDHHALDMLHMLTPDGGCVYIGPGGPPLTTRHSPLRDFGAVVQNFLRLPRPRDELLLHIQFSKYDGMGVGLEMICFTLEDAAWRERLPAIRSVAAEFGLHAYQDEEVQSSWLLSFNTPTGPSRIAEATMALLSRGCGFADEADVVYSAGALDEGEQIA